MVSELPDNASAPEICYYAIDLLKESWDMIPHDGTKMPPMNNALYNSRMAYLKTLKQKIKTMEV